MRKSIEWYFEKKERFKGPEYLPQLKGEWDIEPDKVQWIDDATGLDCLIVRNNTCLNLCGYVGIPKKHPLFSINYSECSLSTAKPRGPKKGDGDPFMKGGPRMPDRWVKKMQQEKVCGEESYCDHQPQNFLDVHGGITFSDKCSENPKHPDQTVCHIDEEGANKEVWWFGFDCAHCDDLSPGMPRFRDIELKYPDVHRSEKYRNIAYVIKECERLAKQLMVKK